MGEATYIPSKAWWKEAVVYQIYPISFFDSNGDGIGDLNGIHAKLDYLKDLGVDVLWLSPIYRSPLADMGYDISDYCDIDPRYGTLADWDNLLKGVHERGMKLMYVPRGMDLVINHTSDEHEWFRQSRSSKTNPKRDWYVWRPPKYDSSGNRHPPNNWQSNFQGPAWDFDEATQEYYLHLYVAKQPDLNWENPEVREAAWDVMRFWIDRGCDGFRMDVINLISKVDGLPDAPITVPGEVCQPASMHFANGPRVHEFIKEMHNKVLSKHDLITVGETPFTYDASHLLDYVLPGNKELNMVFHFELMDIDSPKAGQDFEPLRAKEWKLSDLKSTVSRWQQYKREEGFWNAIFIENHDHSRVVSRFGNDSDEWRALSAKMFAMLQITQSGTQFVYQGQELGLKNFPRSWGIEEYKDVASLNYWNKILSQRQRSTGTKDQDMSDILDGFQKKARDHSRVPMQWDSTSNAGFTQGTPWMRVNEDHQTWNATAEIADETSIHAFWKKALTIRKQYEVLIYGDFKDISDEYPSVFAYIRTLKNTRALVLLNFKELEVDFMLREGESVGQLKFILGNYNIEEPRILSTGSIHLKGHEGRLYISE
ncbi:glycoside hydrolase family 13 protein [Flammula alnicola]|nr:glycoside hydrolase family 13 protein [Flammula alnicola]